MKYQILFLISLLFFVPGRVTADVIWLSGAPPEKVSKKIKPSGMQRLASFRGQKGKERLILWIRSGIYPVESKYINAANTGNPELFIFSPDEELIESKLSLGPKGYTITYNGSIEGFHNIYIIERFVKRDTLYIMVAKAERLSHTCRKGHNKKEINSKLPPKVYKEKIPFEIIRKRLPGEDFHTFLASGDDVTFKVLLNGLPVENLNILITTQKQWAKNLKTNREGEITFQIIGDYFSKWKELNKRKIYNFLLKADYIVKKEGNYKNRSYRQIHYTCSFPGDYIPSETVYKSYIWALIVMIFVITTVSIFIYFHRQRRKKYFR